MGRLGRLGSMTGWNGRPEEAEPRAISNVFKEHEGEHGQNDRKPIRQRIYQSLPIGSINTSSFPHTRWKASVGITQQENG